jgi:DNA-binding transcriptional LysR family regulator
MDLNLLSMFIAVAQGSSFSAAAAKLGLRRSSVSRGVAALERSLGVQLFSRTTRSVALTTAGAALYAKVAPQLTALQEALGTLPEREEQPSGGLRVTAPNDIGAFVLPSIFSGFSMRYPAVHVDLRLTNRMVDLVTEGFDAALRVSTGRLADSTLIARRLSEIERQVFAAPAYLARARGLRTTADAAAHQWVLFRDTKLPPPLPTPKAKPALVGDDILFVREAVSAGMGLGVLPTFMVSEHVAAGKLVRVLPRLSFRLGAIYLVYPQAHYVPRKVTALRDYLVEHFASHPLAAGRSA